MGDFHVITKSNQGIVIILLFYNKFLMKIIKFICRFVLTVLSFYINYKTSYLWRQISKINQKNNKKLIENIKI